jgi:hypothetical protein
MPSPQISEQVSGDEKDPPTQFQPYSMLQVELQPSPFNKAPSSQVSVPILLLSPQIGEQVSATEEAPPAQVYPISIEQVLLHPSPETVFPSSQ